MKDLQKDKIHPQKNKNLIIAAIFACFGVSAEILFTGFKYNVLLPIINQEQIAWQLTGTSYVWMFFIYACIPFLFLIIYNRISNFHWLARAIIYAFICLTVEYITGYILEKVTGSCPWLYTEGIHLHGYIRLDYFPIWMIFGIIAEKLWRYLNKTI